MTVALERSVDIFDVAAETDGPKEEHGQEEDIALGALCRYFGAPVASYTAHLRKDFIGPASAKTQVDGIMLVRCEVQAAGTTEVRELEINDNFRPFDENVLAQLGAIADANWKDPRQRRMIRDICA